MIVLMLEYCSIGNISFAPTFIARNVLKIGLFSILFFDFNFVPADGVEPPSHITARAINSCGDVRSVRLSYTGGKLCRKSEKSVIHCGAPMGKPSNPLFFANIPLWLNGTVFHLDEARHHRFYVRCPPPFRWSRHLYAAPTFRQTRINPTMSKNSSSVVPDRQSPDCRVTA